MAWIGIDGARGVSDTVIQVGTGSDYSSGWLGTGLFGGPSYYAWWETFPTTMPKSCRIRCSPATR